MPSDVDPQILWETTKCAIRGFCIYFSSTLAKAKTHQFTQLENKIQSLQNLQKQHFTEQQATQLSSLQFFSIANKRLPILKVLFLKS